MTEQEYIENQRREAAEHNDAIMHIREILATGAGKPFFKYLLKSFEVGEFPERGLEGHALHDKLGFLRAGNSIFKLLSEANPNVAGVILAELEGERQHELYKDYAPQRSE